MKNKHMKYKRMKLIVSMLVVAAFFKINYCICISAENVYKNENISDREISTDKDSDDNVVNIEYNNILDELEYSEIQSVIEHVMADNNFNFEEMVKKIIFEKEMGIKDYIDEIVKNIQIEIKNKKDLFIKLFILSIISAIFCNFSNIFNNKCVSEMGFYVTYLLQFTLLLSTFLTSYKIVENVVLGMVKFMKALIPTYSVAVIFGTGVGLAGAFYETAIIVINVVYSVILEFILPLINVYTIVSIADNIAQKRMLDKFAKLLKQIITWSLRGLIAIVIGIQSLQRMIFQASDTMKNNVALRTTFSMPVIGDTFENIGGSILDAGVLVKNTVGVTGIIVIIIICGVPFVRILVYNFLYMILGAVVEPIADKRVVNCIGGVSEGEKMLLEVIIDIAALFIIAISMVTG